MDCEYITLLKLVWWLFGLCKQSRIVYKWKLMTINPLYCAHPDGFEMKLKKTRQSTSSSVF